MEDTQQNLMTDRDRKMRDSFDSFEDSGKRKEKSVKIGMRKPADASSTAEWLIKRNNRAEWRQGLLRNLMTENTEAARRAQDATKAESSEKDQMSEQSSASVVANKESVPKKPMQKESSVDQATEKSTKHEAAKLSLATPNIVAAATLNTDPNLAKMNEFYYRRKKSGKVMLTGLVGYALNRQKNTKRPEVTTEIHSALADNETRKVDQTEVSKSNETKVQSAEVRTMTMPELLQLAEQIDAGTGSLKDMYLQGRIDAVNLRKVIAEYSAGRDIKTLLKHSLLAEEMKHELRNEIKTANTQSPVVSKPVVAGTVAIKEELVAQPKEQEFVQHSEHAQEVKDSAQEGAEKPQTDSKTDPAPAQEPPIFADSAVPELPKSDVRTPRYEQNQHNVMTVEYVRVPTLVAIAIGVATGGILAVVLLVFVF